MSRRLLHVPVLCLAWALLAGCGLHSLPGAASRQDGGAIVLRGDELSAGMPLLDALEARVQGLQVSRRTGVCPVVSIRGRTSDRATGASVYVDGTLMRDSCILLQLRTADIERVELYPVTGTPPRGYRAGTGGTIVVFRVR